MTESEKLFEVLKQLVAALEKAEPGVLIKRLCDALKPTANALFDTTIALQESVKLQSHYAELLNQFDGGERHAFSDAQEWIDRLKELELI